MLPELSLRLLVGALLLAGALILGPILLIGLFLSLPLLAPFAVNQRYNDRGDDYYHDHDGCYGYDRSVHEFS